MKDIVATEGALVVGNAEAAVESEPCEHHDVRRIDAMFVGEQRQCGGKRGFVVELQHGEELSTG